MAVRKLITLKLDQQTQAGIQARMRLIQQTEMELVMLRESLNHFIQTATGADLIHEDWTLDLEHALLERPARKRQTRGSNDESVCV